VAGGAAGGAGRQWAAIMIQSLLSRRGESGDETSTEAEAVYSLH
jgi:hypothetical protein